PVPIPNTEVKPASADGTWGGIPWESRSPPISQRREPGPLDRAPRRFGHAPRSGSVARPCPSPDDRADEPASAARRAAAGPGAPAAAGTTGGRPRAAGRRAPGRGARAAAPTLGASRGPPGARTSAPAARAGPAARDGRPPARAGGRTVA